MMNQGNPQEILKVQGQLFTKILNVVKAVEKIEKSGYNKHQDYHYSTESDLVEAVRQLLIANKLIVLTDSETKEVIKLLKYDKGQVAGENLVTVVNTRHTFCDTETGYTYPIQSTGTGYDNTDKGAFKAMTGAMKYFISKNFLVPTEDDPENDGQSKPAPVKGFNRAKATETVVQVTSSSSNGASTSESKVVEVPKVANDTAHVAEKRTAAPATLTQPKKSSFAPRSATKTEPSFP